VPSWPVLLATGLVIGTLYGIFGVGGSSFATPVLGLLGVPGLVAIAAPLLALGIPISEQIRHNGSKRSSTARLIRRNLRPVERMNCHRPIAPAFERA